MGRKRGNPAQEAALEQLLEGLAKVRNVADVREKCKTALTTTHLWVSVDLLDFPFIRIGGRGGFEMPDIRTHPPHSDRFDGIAKTAYEACLWSDKYVNRQGNGAAKDSAFVTLPWERWE
jgi:hypothetical protein